MFGSLVPVVPAEGAAMPQKRLCWAVVVGVGVGVDVNVMFYSVGAGSIDLRYQSLIPTLNVKATILNTHRKHLYNTMLTLTLTHQPSAIFSRRRNLCGNDPSEWTGKRGVPLGTTTCEQQCDTRW